MKKQLFNSYTNNIKAILSSKQGLGGPSERYFNFTGQNENLEKANLLEGFQIEPSTGLHDLASLLGIKVIRKPIKGDHPDFVNLRTKGGFENHYIVSMFLDVRNSTKLHYNHDLLQIARVIQTIVVAATQTCALFGAHIQRIQYDGVFVYFGGKGIDKKQAVKDAINAASFFNYFVKYELRELFEMEDINRIYTRVGIDFGDDKDVMWTIFGLPGCDELTTNSLHSSLPAKMQSNAPNNGIIVGQNLPDLLNDIDSYCDFFRDDRGNIDSSKQHIFKMPDGSFNYGQKIFKWESYLKNTFPFVKADESGRLYIDDQYSAEDEAERKRIALLLKETQTMKERQTIFNQNTRKEVPITPHNFYSDGIA
jgi:adenylate cyclase